ncbi:MULTISPECIES: hypothetical protein [Paraburkholderia]|uniref:Helicase XPB/Ssl2 N-terminal domain-containing protein n=1 Tax=Paraburkholderia podalyriae TaxID=1938811 RepID=A0ABR7Q2D2_9BURK|nr:hypothetical protein [Paraburkholderia podalyriae]MBC8752716.1 hypothetical protein [Paraburkholderia podalyriae]
MNTLNEVLVRLTMDQLKSLMRWLPDAARTGRKDELVGAILKSLSGEGLRALWESLDDIQRLAVAETAYDLDGLFDGNLFRAKYGRLPDFTIKEDGRRYPYYGPPTALGLFLYYQDGRYTLPVDMRERLRTFVPEPEPVRLNTIGTLPEMHGENRLTARHSERDAILDLSVLLRLADQGKIQVSDKTSLPGSATLRLLTENLAGGDFYVPTPTRNQWDQEIGPIKAFSWPLLLQAAALVQRNGSKLALSAAGVKALTSSPADVLGTIWRKWLKSSLFDEFSRIDVIKGQKSKGRVMTALAPRRAAITEILRLCPVGEWVDVDDLSRFMQATDHTFDVTHDPWKLYISEQQYGSLGHDGYHSWAILQLRYLLCFLFEYAAALGIIDVAYIEPTEARSDFGDLWGTDDLQFLSRYDGLIYFRLTPLGAYCLGLSDDYTPAPIQPTVRLSVLPSLQVRVVGGNLSAEELLTLDTWAVQATDKSWSLDRQKAVGSIEKGYDIAELLAFLQAREEQPVPETVESFMKTTQKQGKALKIKGTALLIDCEDAEIADMIATRKETTGLCLRAGDRQLVVRLENEEKFRTLIRSLGFGMAT